MIDASVLTAFYAADDSRRDAVAARLATGDTLFTPAQVDAEVVSALRGMARRSPVRHAAVPAALRPLAGFPIRRVPLAPLLQRIWELQDNITPYDAAYVALAERLDVRRDPDVIQAWMHAPALPRERTASHPLSSILEGRAADGPRPWSDGARRRSSCQ